MDFIKLTQNQGILSVTLNRPEKKNAFHPGMIQELTKAFQQIKKEKSVRAVLLTGEGASFCSGGDLDWMKSMASYTKAQNLQDAKRLFQMYATLRACPVPVLGRIFGHAFGGGAGLAAVCDIVAAEEKTQFCFSEVKWGLVPAVISPFVTERAQPGKVREWFLTAKVFLAPEALSGGLIQFCGRIDEVDAFLETTCHALRAAAPEAVRLTKALHQSYSPLNWKKIEPKVVRMIAERRASSEGQKGLQAFLDKKTPQWSESPYGAPAKI